ILLQREPSPALQRTSDSGPNDKAGSSPRQSSARYASGPTGCHAAAEQAPAGTAGPGRRSPKAAATRGNAARVYHIMQRGPPALKARAVRCALWSRAEQRGAMMDT
ncbi:unnamed protein product, partial [Prorocentrum cordatum]